MVKKIILYGLGDLGKLIAAELPKKGYEIVGAVEKNNDMIGTSLSTVVKDPSLKNIEIKGSIEEVDGGDLVIHATQSKLEDTYPQIRSIVERKIGVLSTCEELVYPYYKHSEIAKDLGDLAMANKVAVVGAGINPGFIMDLRVIFLSNMVSNIERIKVMRVFNPAGRRPSYQKKCGIGFTEQEFYEKYSKGEITGHTGLAESIAMIASKVGMEFNTIREKPPKPFLAPYMIKYNGKTLEAKNVAGFISNAYAMNSMNDKVITMQLVSHLFVKREYDSAEIKGTPYVYDKIYPAINGDTGTVNTVINIIPKIGRLSYGLFNVADLPIK